MSTNESFTVSPGIRRMMDPAVVAIAKQHGWSPSHVVGDRGYCQHGSANGLTDCPQCGLPAQRFICAAYVFVNGRLSA